MKKLRPRANLKPKTAGQQVLEHLQSNPDEVDSLDVVAGVAKDYETKFLAALDDGRKKWPLKDFFIEVLTKHERQLGAAVAIQHVARPTCPTPNYDQSVYVFQAVRQDIKLLWALPNRTDCFDMLKRHKTVLPAEEQLKNYIVAFALGDLYKLAKEMNKEKHGLINPILYLKDNKENL